MVVFANRRLGPAAEVMVSCEVASGMLQAVASAARPVAAARWEHELVRWLESRAARVPSLIDVSEIAWTPEHFEHQQRFMITAVEHAAAASEHARPLLRWAHQIAGYTRDAVPFGRRWAWNATA
jgi:hypothetical protein